MKSKIFMYLFLFAVLYIIFQYANVKKTFETQEAQIEKLEKDVEKLQSERDSIADRNVNYQAFSLATDDKARMYIEDLGYNVPEMATKIESEIISKNKIDADNELVPYNGMEGIMRINRIRIVNHKWVLAEFTDGVFWGEVLIRYFIDDKGNLSFETSDAVLYPN